MFSIENIELPRGSRQFGELLAPLLADVLGYETAQNFQNKPISESNKEINENFEKIESLKYLTK